MKKMLILFMGMLSVISFVSCGNKKEVSVKNNSTTVLGDLKDYLEVVNGDYVISKTDKGIFLPIKFKVIKPVVCDYFDHIYLELTDKNGMPIPNISKFKITIWSPKEQYEKVKNSLKNDGMEFVVSFDYDGDDKDFSIMREKASGFSIISSEASIESSETTSLSLSESSSVFNDSSSNFDDEDNEDNKKVVKSNTNWDKVLSDYEAYVDKYIKLLKKASSGDVSAMSEYMEMLEKAQELQSDLENAEGELTPSQLQKFNKINMKLINASSGF